MHVEENFDPEQRILCTQDTCLGVIDETGLCPICNNKAKAPTEATAASTEPSVQPTLLMTPDESLGDFTERRLCKNDHCLGVIGPTGCCTECGLL